MLETDALQRVKKVSEEIVEGCKTLSKWTASAAYETQRKYQNEKQQISRKQELLQSTVLQLKEENARLLEERQTLALETENEAAEVQRLREEQISIEQRLAVSKAKAHAMAQQLQTESSELSRLRKRLKKEEERSEKERDEAVKKTAYYKEKLSLEILPLGTGCVNFIFSVNGRPKNFVIEMCDTYVIHQCTLEESEYTDLLSTLKQTQDLFAFIKGMSSLFASTKDS
ncbi:hypothetical protein NEDG_00275 [Nematocida displodere]|uniref:Kinetochore protein SPC25 n=1 Tax=Nematocida displodere TaxID=1805483 RepID=A0A177EKA5_9MICR|nr:hypothetical protein NEDG_00275 [Nematocida displodere]